MAPTDEVNVAGQAEAAETAAAVAPATPPAATAAAPSDAPGAQSSGAASSGPAQDAPDVTPAEDAPPPPKPESLIDAIADLMQMAVNYMRQETAGVMRDKVVLPGQQLGMLVAFALAAAALLFLGIGFISVAVLLVLAHYLGWPGALALVGAILLIGAGVFTYLKVRSIQS